MTENRLHLEPWSRGLFSCCVNYVWSERKTMDRDDAKMGKNECLASITVSPRGGDTAGNVISFGPDRKKWNLTAKKCKNEGLASITVSPCGGRYSRRCEFVWSEPQKMEPPCF